MYNSLLKLFFYNNIYPINSFEKQSRLVTQLILLLPGIYFKHDHLFKIRISDSEK
jgi:hypothetical protein